MCVLAHPLQHSRKLAPSLTLFCLPSLFLLHTCHILHLYHLLLQVLAVDIHPAARFGRGILLDHGTGVVIGETAVVGNNVSLLQVGLVWGGMRPGHMRVGVG